MRAPIAQHTRAASAAHLAALDAQLGTLRRLIAELRTLVPVRPGPPPPPVPAPRDGD